MFERFTERAKRVLFFARYEASTLGDRVIDTEHPRSWNGSLAISKRSSGCSA